MKYINMTTKSHELLLPFLSKNSISVDMTLGNGNDTLFLAKHSKFVYAFDIQQKALDTSLDLLNIHDLNNYKLILDSHENILNYVDRVDVAIFNLGYLPGSDKTITTNYKVTINALNKLMNIKTKAICIVVYPGHTEGKIESDNLSMFSKSKHRLYNISEIKNNHLSNKAPYILFYTLIEQ